MRYPDGQPPDPAVPYGDTMHDMLTLTMWMSIVIGLCLYAAARYGRVLWLKVWSLGLIGCSVIYLVGDATGVL